MSGYPTYKTIGELVLQVLPDPSGTMSAAQLIAWMKTYESRSPPTNKASEAYGLFVKHRGLRPEIPFKEFRPLWNTVPPMPRTWKNFGGFAPQYFDPLRGELVQLFELENATEYRWENGGTGRDPDPPEGADISAWGATLKRLVLLPAQGPRYEVEGLQDGWGVIDRWRKRALPGSVQNRSEAIRVAARLEHIARFALRQRWSEWPGRA